jgi:hypothetical protein
MMLFKRKYQGRFFEKKKKGKEKDRDKTDIFID